MTTQRRRRLTSVVIHCLNVTTLVLDSVMYDNANDDATTCLTIYLPKKADEPEKKLPITTIIFASATCICNRPREPEIAFCLQNIKNDRRFPTVPRKPENKTHI